MHVLNIERPAVMVTSLRTGCGPTPGQLHGTRGSCHSHSLKPRRVYLLFLPTEQPGLPVCPLTPRRAPSPPARAAGSVLAVGSSPRLRRPRPARTHGYPRPGRPCPRSGPLGPPPARTHSRRSAPRQPRPRSAAASAMLGSAGGSGESPRREGGSASREESRARPGPARGEPRKWLSGAGLGGTEERR